MKYNEEFHEVTLATLVTLICMAGGLKFWGTEIGLEEAETYRVQVITGANLSGKSVYLKQVGLITYMAQIGCFVPADEAELGLCDFIFSRIQSCETASATCSSFTLDLWQLSLALKHSTAASLVLLDEFGKGTRAADGVALLGSTIEYLCRWQDGPKALVATHFTEIFRLGLVSETEPHLQVSHLRVLPQSENSTSSIDQIAYLYQLVPGCAEKSFGLDCARKAGLDADVLQRAAEILSMIERRKAIPLKPIERQGARQVALCRSMVQRLCALDLENETETKEFLAFVSQSRENLGSLGGAWFGSILVDDLWHLVANWSWQTPHGAVFPPEFMSRICPMHAG